MRVEECIMLANMLKTSVKLERFLMFLCVLKKYSFPCADFTVLQVSPVEDELFWQYMQRRSLDSSAVAFSSPMVVL